MHRPTLKLPFSQLLFAALSQFHNQFAAQPQFQQQRSSSSCPEANGTYPVAGQCDAYILCKNGVAEEMLCPDGLLFNEKLGPHHFPCQYPIDVSCENRAKLQSPQATDECPHQFGYFKMGDRVNCGQFMNCVNGRGFMFDCPEGLAFSQETYRCEWPDQVSDCDAEAFVGFSCPPEARTDEVTHFNFYRNAQDCQVYYICLEGRPRMYRCGEGKLFDTLNNHCEAAENVTTCGSASFRAAPVAKPVPIQYSQPRVVPTPAPVVVTQKPFQFQQFATPAAPRTQQFNAFQQQQPAQQFAQPKSAFSSFAPRAAPTQAPIAVKDTYDFVQPRFGSGVEAASVPVQQPFSAFSQTARTTQPESPRSETRSQIGNNVGQFNFRSSGRGSQRYQGN